MLRLKNVDLIQTVQIGKPFFFVIESEIGYSLLELSTLQCRAHKYQTHQKRLTGTNATAYFP